MQAAHFPPGLIRWLGLAILTLCLATGCDRHGSSEATDDSASAVDQTTFTSISGETPWLFGMHEPGGESRMKGAGHPGWIVFTEAIGHDANNLSGGDYSWAANQGYGVIVRLNNGYNDDAKAYHPGALPCETDYGSFATRAANFAWHSSGAHIWLIANETNFSREWPACGVTECQNKDDKGNLLYPNRQPITAARYATAFRQVRDAIKMAGHGHEHDQVIVQGTAPVNDEVICAAGTPANYDWVSYHVDILNRLYAPNEIHADGFALHAYTHRSDSRAIDCEAPFADDHCFADPANGAPSRHYEFRSYRDFLEATPDFARQLPVYITESDQERDPSWDDTPNDWVQKAYAEIDGWNQNPANQRIRALTLYRWAPYIDDNNKGDVKYDISRRPNVLNDFAAALNNSYRWDHADCDTDPVTQQRMCDGPNGRFRASFYHFGVTAVGRPLEPEHCVGDDCYQTYERVRMNRSAQAPCPYGACLAFSGITALEHDTGQGLVDGVTDDDAFTAAGCTKGAHCALCDDPQYKRRTPLCVGAFGNMPATATVGKLAAIYDLNHGLELYGYPISRVLASCPWEGGSTRPCFYTERAKLGYFGDEPDQTTHQGHPLRGTSFEWQGMRLGAQELGQ